MKAFLQVLLYLICSECRIENGPVEQISYEVLISGQADNKYKDYNPFIIKDLNDFTNFYRDFYGSYPGYTDFDFTKNMIVIFFSSSSYAIDVENVWETNDQISIHMARPNFDAYPKLHCGSPVNYSINTYYTAVSIKRSHKTVRVYN